MRTKTLLSILFALLFCIGQSRQAQAEFWWGDVNGTNFLILQRNQNSPHGCVASFAFSTTSAISDRIKIMRQAQWPDVVLSPQVLLSCSDNNNGCKGGSPLNAYDWIKRNNITDVTCSPYQALDSETGLHCSSTLKCVNCMWDRFVPEKEQCTPQPRAKVYAIKEFGVVSGEQAIIDEVRKNGPVTCTISITQSFLDYRTGVLQDSGEAGLANHHISITGWGVEKGVKYWRGRNSWGSQWGEGGDFRMARGSNFLNIESNCSWATPLDTWTKDIRNETKPRETQQLENTLLTQQKRASDRTQKCKRFSTKLVPEHVISPRPHEYLDANELPENWDWRNVSGVNYLSWTKNQRAPHYCGACWIEAATSVVADRINIARQRVWPDISIAPQVIINCKYGGSCDGGNPGHIYMYGKEVGLPEESCQAYTAKNPPQFLCSNEQICHKCTASGCAPAKRYPVWKVLEHGLVEGAQRMKAEIYARGPITCGIDATNRWEDYSGGIYSESKLILDENHEISVVGWGKENGVEYWIGRNSYGTHWGEHGFFRITMHRNNLGIELECSWAVVDKEPHIIELDGQQPTLPDGYVATVQ